MDEIAIILILILLNGIFAMSEIAVISARKSSLSTDLKKGSKSAKMALKLANDPDRFLSTVQIGITLIGILTGIYSGASLADDFSDLLTSAGFPQAYARLTAQTIIIILVTYLSIIFGELVPKRIGLSMAEKASKAVARPMYFLSVIAAPFVWILAKSTEAMFNLLGIKEAESKVTEEEIKSIVQEGKEDGEVQEVEQDIVERVFLLGDLKVSSLMTHRSDIVALDIHNNEEEIKAILEENLYETYPVIDRTFDNTLGIVGLKDLIFRFGQKNAFKLEEVVHPATYFHDNMSVYKALEQMKEHRLSQAFICDEFGSFQGIITLKDILGGLVGSIEGTTDEPEIIKRNESDSWLVDGQCTFYNFLSYFDQEDLYDSDSNYSTVGGLILELLEHIPQSGEQVDWKGFHFEIVDMDGARIDKVLVTADANILQGNIG